MTRPEPAPAGELRTPAAPVAVIEAPGASARSRRARVPSRWVFGVAAIPFGGFNGLVAVGVPYILRRHGVPVGRIAAIVALVQIPAVWYVLWAPVVDFALRRRTWIAVLGAASGIGAAIALALMMAPSAHLGAARSLGAASVALVAASVLAQPTSSALGALMAEALPEDLRARAAGWSQAGILGGGVLIGGVAVWLGNRSSALAAALVVGALIGLPGLLALTVDEPPPRRAPLGGRLREMAREVAVTFRRRDVWLAALLFLSPAGAGALMNLFSAVAPDFRASPAVVLWSVALGGLMTTTGALAGGFVLERLTPTARWRAYPATGIATGAALALMLAAPLRPATFLAGASMYALATGFGYAVFMALALELMGTATAASGTRFTLFMAMVTVPVVYMLRLDGAGYVRFGARGMLAADAIANAAVGLVLFVVLARWRMAPREPSLRSGDSPPTRDP